MSLVQTKETCSLGDTPTMVKLILWFLGMSRELVLVNMLLKNKKEIGGKISQYC